MGGSITRPIEVMGGGLDPRRPSFLVAIGVFVIERDFRQGNRPLRWPGPFLTYFGFMQGEAVASARLGVNARGRVPAYAVIAAGLFALSQGERQPSTTSLQSDMPLAAPSG